MLGAKDDEKKPYHSADYSSTPYPMGSKYQDPSFAQSSKRHSKELTCARKRGDEEEIQARLETKPGEPGSEVPSINQKT